MDSIICAFFGLTVGIAVYLRRVSFFEVSALSNFSVGLVSLALSIATLAIALIACLSIGFMGVIIVS